MEDFKKLVTDFRALSPERQESYKRDLERSAGLMSNMAGRLRDHVEDFPAKDIGRLSALDSAAALEAEAQGTQAVLENINIIERLL